MIYYPFVQPRSGERLLKTFLACLLKIIRTSEIIAVFVCILPEPDILQKNSNIPLPFYMLYALFYYYNV